MENFIKYEHNVSKIVGVFYVVPGDKKHVHNDRPSHGLAYFPKKSCEYTFSDGKKFHCSEGVIIYMPKGSSYVVTETSNERTCYAINFQISEDVNFEPFMMNVKNSSDFFNAFKNAHNMWEHKKTAYVKKCISYLYDILYNLECEYDLGYISKSKAELCSPAIDYIHQNFTKEVISIPHLASLCKMSEGYFRRLFKKYKGTSPKKYINNLKISYARDLISSNLYSLREVAELSGYTEMGNFSREFKKYTGVSPSEYNGINVH